MCTFCIPSFFSYINPMKKLLYISTAVALLIISSCGPGGGSSQNPQYRICRGDSCFYLDTFAVRLKLLLADSVVKYAFVVRNGTYEVSGASGIKRTASDPPQENFTIYDRFNPASVTKTITAVGLLQLMAKKNIAPEDKIYKYLPSTWNIPSSSKVISFRMLMKHEAGILNDSIGLDFNAVKKAIEDGVRMQDTGVMNYRNLNYSVCRVLIAYLDGYSNNNVTDNGKVICDTFVNYLQRNIFTPIGISGISFKPNNYDATLFYVYPAGTTNGSDLGDWSLTGGAAGIQISVHELADFLTHLKLGQGMLPDTMRTLMYNNDLGWDVRPGILWNIAGDFFNGKGGFLDDNGRQVHCWIDDFQNGLQISLVVNTSRNIDITNAYLTSWYK